MESNFVRLSGIPTLSSLLASLSPEIEPAGEFERELILAYTRVQQLRAVLEDCDLELIQEILAAREEVAASDPSVQNAMGGISERASTPPSQITVFVVGKLVNIRAGPSLNHTILEQVPYGTILIIDQATLASLPPSEKNFIEQGSGWLPIFLPDGRRGYIYSLYVTS
jgi:hypothetical protein